MSSEKILRRTQEFDGTDIVDEKLAGKGIAYYSLSLNSRVWHELDNVIEILKFKEGQFIAGDKKHQDVLDQYAKRNPRDISKDGAAMIARRHEDKQFIRKHDDFGDLP